MIAGMSKLKQLYEYMIKLVKKKFTGILKITFNQGGIRNVNVEENIDL